MEHPLKSDPVAGRNDEPNPNCLDCGRRLVVCWPSRLVCLSCAEKKPVHRQTVDGQAGVKLLLLGSRRVW